MKRSEIKRRPLADSVLKLLEPEEKVYREKDSPGLYFQVKPSGSKSWLLRYKRPDSKWSWFGLGSFPAVSGKQARDKAREWLEANAKGEGPGAEKVDVVTFRVIAEAWIQHKEALGRKPKTLSRMRAHLDNDIYPVIGDKPLEAVTRGDCANIVRTIAQRNATSMADKVAGWLKQIYSLAVAEGKCELNPASELHQIVSHKETNHPWLLEAELPAFLQDLDKSNAVFNTLVLLRLNMLTLCRPGEARLATWSEFDLEAGSWSIPNTRMKMGRPFVSPLPRQTIEDLRHLKAITGRQAYLFPGFGSKHPVQSENSVNKAIAQIGWKGRIVGHGFRHTGSTLLREHNWRKDFVEAQLSHVEGGTAGVYNKAQYLEQRREMVQWYADYLDALKTGITGEVQTQFNEAVRQ